VINNQSEMGYHKDNIRMMKQPKQLQGTPLHMNYIPFFCWIDWHMPPQTLDHHHQVG